MTLEKWAHASEVFGSVAIVLSLVVLIAEVRSNTAVQERQMEMERTLNYTDMFLSSPELSGIIAKVKAVDGSEPLASAFIDRYGLSSAEAILWSRAVQRGLFIWHSQYSYSGPSAALAGEIRAMWKYPDLRIAFEVNEDGLLSPQFIAYVESIVADRQQSTDGR